MVNQLEQTSSFLRHTIRETSPFVQRRTTPAPQWDDEALHRASFRRDPELYALCGLALKVSPAQQARVLFQILGQSRVGLSAEVSRTLERVARQLLTALDARQVLTVFLALRRTRANHKHTARTILRYLLNHPALEELARQRRPTLADCLEHALGKNVARACARFLAEGNGNEPYVQSHLLRLAEDPARVAAVVPFLFGKAPGPPPRSDAEAARLGPTALEAAATEAPRTVTATNRGTIAAVLVHIYQGGANPELREALNGYVRDAVAPLPHFDGTVALVLDASASTRGYGEREYCCISQSQALRLVLEQCCTSLRVYPVGGSGDPPRPEGETDLAGALLDALEGNPDVVVIVSDGYENVADGDLARVVASLPAAGVSTPVVFCHSKFSAKDDLALRRPAPELPELEFWHQDDFAEVLWMLFAQARPPRGDAFVRGRLRQRLAELEKERTPWISKL
jgi:hypothetical protein